MNLPITLPGDDAPSIAFDGSRLVLTYAAGAYARRCSADDAAVRALASHTVVSAEAEAVAVIGAPVDASTPQRVTYALAAAPVAVESLAAPVESPSSTTSPKPRR